VNAERALAWCQAVNRELPIRPLTLTALKTTTVAASTAAVGDYNFTGATGYFNWSATLAMPAFAQASSCS
jgi:hypothetical protein